MEGILLWYYGRNKHIFWSLNNSEYHHREMGLLIASHQNDFQLADG